MAKTGQTIHRRNGYGDKGCTYYPVVIIGAGESGIAMGCRLKEALGFDQFRIFERQAGIGGTWWINRYPGVACDVPAIFYSFSFAQNKGWTTLHPAGSEIVQYLMNVCARYQIVDKIQLNTEVKVVRWLNDEEEWEVTLGYLVPGTGDLSSDERADKVAAEGVQSVYIGTEIVRAKIVVSGVGGLVEPKHWPKDIPGLDNFEGQVMHTARWDDSVDMGGKHVVVVGSGCSAAQVVPQLVKPAYNAKSVTQLMRSPPWVLPNLLPPQGLKVWENHSAYVMESVPGLSSTFRVLLFFLQELVWFQLMKNNSFTHRQRPVVEKQYLEYMRRHTPEKYHELLTPDYSLGCKRRVLDGEWLRSLHDSRVELTTLPLTRVNAKSVTLGPGRHYPPLSKTDSKVPTDEVREVSADVIILANGYQTNEWLHPLRVVGKTGKTMQEVWDGRGGAQAYLGIAMDHFPNFFMIFGPNTVTGHTSVIFASENAVEYSLRFIKPILKGEVSTYEVTEQAERAWTNDVQKALQTTVFGSGGCRSWYKTESGWNSTTYPYSQIDYWFRCRFPVWKHWIAKYTPKGQRVRRIKRFLLVAAVTSLVWVTQTNHGRRSWSRWTSSMRKWLSVALVGMANRVTGMRTGA